jgi:hypothetical protein
MTVVKVIELVGTSKRSFDDAVKEALKEAARTLHGIHGIHVESFNAKVEGNKIVEYRADVKIAFVIERK